MSNVLNPTIRQMAGAPLTTALQVARTAVLVIDFQNEYFAANPAIGHSGGRMVIPDGEAALQQTRRVLAFADRHGIPVIHVAHVLPAGAPLFAAGSSHAGFHPQMQPREGEVVIEKDNVSVFAGASAAAIDAALNKAGVDTLIITGLQTHACVSGATRDAAAAPRGYRVIVVADAVASRDLELADGSRIDHRSLHAASLATLEDTYAEVMDTAQVLALPVRTEAVAAC